MILAYSQAMILVYSQDMILAYSQNIKSLTSLFRPLCHILKTCPCPAGQQGGGAEWQEGGASPSLHYREVRVRPVVTPHNDLTKEPNAFQLPSAFQFFNQFPKALTMLLTPKSRLYTQTIEYNRRYEVTDSLGLVPTVHMRSRTNCPHEVTDSLGLVPTVRMRSRPNRPHEVTD